MKTRHGGLAIALCLISLVRGAYAAPGDIAFPRKDVQEIPAAVFPHWFHRIRYRCLVCHEDLFPMQVTTEGNSMDDINAGRSCGTCHNGKTAWGTSFGTCIRCHPPQKK